MHTVVRISENLPISFYWIFTYSPSFFQMLNSLSLIRENAGSPCPHVYDKRLKIEAKLF